MSKHIPYFHLIVAIFIWGFSFLATKYTVAYIAPGMLTFLRTIIGTIFLFFFCIPKFKYFNKKLLLLNIITALFVAGAYITQTIGLKYATSAMSSFLENLYLVVVPLLTWIITKRKPSIFSVIASILCIGGVILISIPTGVFNSPSGTLGVILSGIAGILFGFNIALTGNIAKDKQPTLYTFIQFLVISIVSGLYTLIFERQAPVFNQESIIGILFLGLLSSGMAWMLRNHAQNHIDSNVIAIFIPFCSVIAMVVSIIIGETELSTYFVIGVILMLGAILIEPITTLVKAKKKDKDEKAA